MRPRRALCVSRDEGVRRVVGEALAAAGLEVEHLDALPSPVIDALPTELAVIVVDRATRQLAGEALRGAAAPVVVVGDDLEDDGLVVLMLEAPVSHLMRDLEDPDLGVTSVKLATGDLFGLEKYLAPGARVGERVVQTEAERWHAMNEVAAWAEAVGARQPVVLRIRSVVDELLMNALRDPAGRPRRGVLRWASDATRLAISVGDAFGDLRQRDVIDNLRRARSERGRPRDDSPSGGAGLGLYLVLANVASFVVNITPGHQTEVVCLFDLARPTRKGAIASSVRSLHVFQALAS